MGTMPIRQIGSLDVTVVGLGCNNFGGRLDEGQSTAVVNATLDAGINFFDTADVYGSTLSEEFLGRALGRRRSEAVVATKFGMPLDDEHQGAAPAYVKSALEDSLHRLGTDYVDLYQLHRPDPAVPIGDTLAALGELVAAGKVREIGCSNFSARQLEEAREAAASGGPRFVSVQNQYSLLHREPELGVLETCQKLGIAFIPFFPLMMGLLSGKFRPGQAPVPGTRIAGMPPQRQQELFTEERWQVIGGLETFAAQRGHTLLELAVAWLAAQPAVASVIAGATKAEQVAANAKAGDWVLSAEEAAEVSRIVPPPAG
jgi:aryl-alcohol dehydrogenase-like predicted oxidoreductase